MGAAQSQQSKSVVPTESIVAHEKAPTRLSDRPAQPIGRVTPGTLVDNARGGGELKGPAIDVQSMSLYRERFTQDPMKQLSARLLSNQDWSSALNTRPALEVDLHVFNHTISRENSVRVDQQSTGRCWIFALCNVARREVAKKLDMPSIELSQPYLALYDKLEKANYLLENMIELHGEDLDSRLVQTLLDDAVNDGGCWHMLENLVKKYGLMPKVCFGETFNTSHTNKVNKVLRAKLLEDSLELRALCNKTVQSLDEAGVMDGEARHRAILTACRERKEKAMAEVYGILAIAAGGALHCPDEPFTFDYVTRSGKAQSITATPLEFSKKYCNGFDPQDYVSLTNDPRNDFSSLLTVDRLNNMAGSNMQKAAYINTSADRLIAVVKSMIDADQPLWFGCDVGQKSSTPLGVMDTALYDDETPFGIKLGMTKAERLQTGISSMTHAMCITAYHEDSKGEVTRFRVENSWGNAPGYDKGWFLMTSSWFREYVYQVVAPKSFVPKDLLAVHAKGEATVLPRWDPMGSLA